MSVTVAYLGPAGTFTEAALWEFAHRGHLTTPVTDTKTMLDDATRGGETGLEGGAAAASPAGKVFPPPSSTMPPLTAEEREELLKGIIHYIALHQEISLESKTLDILHTVLHT